jgi:hypothetical protein
MGREEVLRMRVTQIAYDYRATGHEHVVTGVRMQVHAADDVARETDGVVQLYLVAGADGLLAQGAGGAGRLAEGRLLAQVGGTWLLGVRRLGW